jgi:glycosyltransferase involved in cell wall biosynthesis
LKLVIQIPCLDEEITLPATLADLPRSIPGIRTIETLVVDDGSRDRTSEAAHALGVTRVVRFAAHQGLAAAFARGLQEALAMGADIIVNTDADNHYCAEDIPRLIAPILAGTADMVIGDRQVDQVADFSPVKKWLQKLGSRVVRALSHTSVPDATSGFRAYSREAALRLTVVSGFTYTLETLIQGAQKNLTITQVPIHTNPRTRPSRLFTSTLSYIQRSIATMARVYVLYQPLKVFVAISGAFLIAALLLFARFVYFWLATRPAESGHVQSLVVAGVLAVIGVLVAGLGLLSDLTAMNRRMLEEVMTHTRVLRYGRGSRDERRAPGQERRHRPDPDALREIEELTGGQSGPGGGPDSR